MARAAHIRQDSALWYGADHAIVFTIVDALGAPVNITGWALSWKARGSIDGPDLFTAKTVGAGIALTTPSSGVCTVTVTAANLRAAGVQSCGYHELKRTDSGFEWILAAGVLEIRAAAHA